VLAWFRHDLPSVVEVIEDVDELIVVSVGAGRTLIVIENSPASPRHM
jgi:hypothetical protein